MLFHIHKKTKIFVLKLYNPSYKERNGGRLMFKSSTVGTASAVKEISIKNTAAEGAVALMAFLCGAFSIAGAFNPVGIACVMAFLGEGRRFYTAAVFAAAGYMLGGWQLFVSDYAVALLLCLIYGIIKNRSSPGLAAGEKALAAFIIFMTAGIAKGIIEKDILYIITVYALEGLILFSLVYIFDRGAQSMGMAGALGRTSREDAAGLCAIAAFAAAGAAVIYKGPVPLALILSFYIFLSAGAASGTKAGTASGASSGISSGTASGAEASAAAGIFAALAMLLAGAADIRMFVLICAVAVLSGYLGRSGRLMTVAACMSGTSIMGYYLDILTLPLILGAAAACLMYIISFGKLSGAVSQAVPGTTAEERCADMRDYIAKKLYDSSKGIAALYESFKDPGKDNAEKETEEMADKVACMACENCRLKENCWTGSFYNTYGTLLSLFSMCEKNGSVNRNDLPSVFRDYCVKQDEFTEAVNITYNSHREKLIWKMKLRESRQIASQQLRTVSELMKSMASEVENRDIFKGSLEKVLFYELRKKDGNVERVSVEEGENGEYEVSVYRNGCGGRQACRDITADTVSGILGRTMKRKEKECSVDENGRCRLVLCEKCGFRVTAAAAMAIKDDENVSGDSYSFIELPRGGYMIALSDGMGSGSEAGEESRTVIELLEQFSELGFKRDVALQMINSALVMGNDRESFATLDICCIDLYTGKAEFIKTGAAATFVIRDGKAKAIRSSSLPMGMLKYFDMDRSEYKLKKNDIVLMLTDGAAEVMDRDGMSDAVLTALMKDNKMKDPKDIAGYVLDSLKERSGFRIQDDMTVVAARIW